MRSIYLASPLGFAESTRAFMEHLVARLREHGGAHGEAGDGHRREPSHRPGLVGRDARRAGGGMAGMDHAAMGSTATRSVTARPNASPSAGERHDVAAHQPTEEPAKPNEPGKQDA